MKQPPELRSAIQALRNTNNSRSLELRLQQAVTAAATWLSTIADPVEHQARLLETGRLIVQAYASDTPTIDR